MQFLMHEKFTQERVKFTLCQCAQILHALKSQMVWNFFSIICQFFILTFYFFGEKIQLEDTRRIDDSSFVTILLQKFFNEIFIEILFLVSVCVCEHSR